MQLKVITPEGLVLNNVPSESFIVPVVDGAHGILRNHAPMVSALQPGILKYQSTMGWEKIALSGGFAEFSGDLLTVLADTAEPGMDIDVARAKAAMDRARQRLVDKQANVDRVRAMASLRRSVARLQAAGVLEDSSLSK